MLQEAAYSLRLRLRLYAGLLVWVAFLSIRFARSDESYVRNGINRSPA
jgi:hypothetical protein